jgi:hypothetical protein
MNHYIIILIRMNNYIMPHALSDITSLHVTYYGRHDLPQGLWIINEYFKLGLQYSNRSNCFILQNWFQWVPCFPHQLHTKHVPEGSPIWLKIAFYMYYLQHERPCCIGYTNSSRRREFAGISDTTRTRML